MRRIMLVMLVMILAIFIDPIVEAESDHSVPGLPKALQPQQQKIAKVESKQGVQAIQEVLQPQQQKIVKVESKQGVQAIQEVLRPQQQKIVKVESKQGVQAIQEVLRPQQQKIAKAESKQGVQVIQEALQPQQQKIVKVESKQGIRELQEVLRPQQKTSIAAVSGQDGPYHFGFKRSKNGSLPSIDQEGFKPLLQKHGAIFLGDTSKKELYLTFDNGYENGYTARILDVLKEKKVPAAFFVTGHYVKTQPELLKRMAAEGHLIGNHSWSHPDMTTISDAAIANELDKVKQAVAEITGQQEMKYLRPPRGIFDERVLAVSSQLGYTNVYWSVAYADWDTKQVRGAQYAYDKVMSQLHPGAVILLHSVSRDNAEALGRIIDDARKLGYEFKSLDQLQVKTY